MNKNIGVSIPSEMVDVIEHIAATLGVAERGRGVSFAVRYLVASYCRRVMVEAGISAAWLAKVAPSPESMVATFWDFDAARRVKDGLPPRDGVNVACRLVEPPRGGAWDFVEPGEMVLVYPNEHLTVDGVERKWTPPKEPKA